MRSALKTLSLIALAAAIAVGLNGCYGSDEPQDQPTEDKAPESDAPTGD